MSELEEDFSYIVVGVSFGEGSYGTECEVCRQDDYGRGGMIDHLPGCDRVTRMVRVVRAGEWESQMPPPLPGSREEFRREERSEDAQGRTVRGVQEAEASSAH